MAGIKINRITNANIYADGNSFLGRASSIDLPELTQKTDDHKALGMIGEIETFTGFEKLTGKVMWSSFFSDVFAKIAKPGKAVKLQVRANLEEHTTDGLLSEVPLVCYLTVRFKKVPMGNYKQHENAEFESEFTAYYAKMERDGVEVFEFDPMSNIYTVSGEDQLSTYRANLGI